MSNKSYDATMSARLPGSMQICIDRNSAGQITIKRTDGERESLIAQNTEKKQTQTSCALLLAVAAAAPNVPTALTGTRADSLKKAIRARDRNKRIKNALGKGLEEILEVQEDGSICTKKSLTLSLDCGANGLWDTVQRYGDVEFKNTCDKEFWKNHLQQKEGFTGRNQISSALAPLLETPTFDLAGYFEVDRIVTRLFSLAKNLTGNDTKFAAEHIKVALSNFERLSDATQVDRPFGALAIVASALLFFAPTDKKSALRDGITRVLNEGDIKEVWLEIPSLIPDPNYQTTTKQRLTAALCRACMSMDVGNRFIPELATTLLSRIDFRAGVKLVEKGKTNLAVASGTYSTSGYNLEWKQIPGTEEALDKKWISRLKNLVAELLEGQFRIANLPHSVKTLEGEGTLEGESQARVNLLRLAFYSIGIGLIDSDTEAAKLTITMREAIVTLLCDARESLERSFEKCRTIAPVTSVGEGNPLRDCNPTNVKNPDHAILYACSVPVLERCQVWKPNNIHLVECFRSLGLAPPARLLGQKHDPDAPKKAERTGFWCKPDPVHTDVRDKLNDMGLAKNIKSPAVELATIPRLVHNVNANVSDAHWQLLLGARGFCQAPFRGQSELCAIVDYGAHATVAACRSMGVVVRLITWSARFATLFNDAEQDAILFEGKSAFLFSYLEKPRANTENERIPMNLVDIVTTEHGDYNAADVGSLLLASAVTP